MEGEQVLRRLDRLIAILELAFQGPIAEAREVIRSDAVTASILDATADGWVAAGELRRRVAAASNQSERTVSRRLASLVARAYVEVEGQGPSLRYRSSGLV